MRAEPQIPPPTKNIKKAQAPARHTPDRHFPAAQCPVPRTDPGNTDGPVGA